MVSDATQCTAYDVDMEDVQCQDDVGHDGLHWANMDGHEDGDVHEWR